MSQTNNNKSVLYQLSSVANTPRVGKVYLVGAGPGDPDLLTVKAQRLVTQAEVVVYDRLISAGVLALIPASAKRIYVGKRDGHHHVKQEQINELLVLHARAGREVVRLKGGDPFVFGRGSEEAVYLQQHGIPFEVIPGVTAATACATYAGIPLTHRELARSVQFVTGHACGDQPLNIDWSKLTDPQTTVVIYMGLRHLPEIVDQLIAAGRSPATPAALIEKGTTPEQRRCLATLAQLPERAQSEGIHSPALIVVGEVVQLAEQLDWFSDALFPENELLELSG